MAGFKADAVGSRATSGVWAKFNGGEFLVRHISYDAFQRRFVQLQHPHRYQMQKGNLDPATSKDILCTAMAEHILVGWKGVETDEGELAFNVDNAKKVLELNDDLRTFIQEFSLELENFRRTEAQEVAKK